MKPSTSLHANRAAIQQIVSTYRANNARVLGSVVRGEDANQSDLDVFVDPTSATTLMDIVGIQVELEGLLGVTVDVLTPKALPEKFRSRVLAEAVPV